MAIEEDQNLICKLNKIIGEELKYSELCRKLDLPVKTGNSKTAQLSNLENYCDMEIIDNYPTKYKIIHTYPEAITILSGISNNDKFQIIFDSILYQACLNNHCYPLYLSNIELLKLFKEVNDNFSYVCNRENMKKLTELTGQNYLYMTDMSQIVYKILKRWTQRKIKQMEKRKIILTRPGFRLYKKIDTDAYYYIIPTNVKPDSDLEKQCQIIYNQAAKENFGDQWSGEWVPEYKWILFENKIKQLIMQYFNGAYTDMKNIIIFSLPNEQWLINKLHEIYQEIPELEKINIEVCNKIWNTKQLNSFSYQHKQLFINTTIIENPVLNIKEKIKEKI